MTRNPLMKAGEYVKYHDRIYTVEEFREGFYKIKGTRPYCATQWVEYSELTLLPRPNIK